MSRELLNQRGGLLRPEEDRGALKGETAIGKTARKTKAREELTVAGSTVRNVLAQLVLPFAERHGRSLEGPSDQGDTLVHEQPVLASCYAASAGDVQLLGAAPGAKTERLVRSVRLVPSPTEALAEVGGVNVHAKVVVDGRDRKRLERLCRYVARPPLNQERLELHPDGRVRLAFKAAWKDGTHAVLLDPLDFLARLCALVPPPRFR